jgi:hypothetical protein
MPCPSRNASTSDFRRARQLRFARPRPQREPHRLGGKAQSPDIFQNLPKCWLRCAAHCSICIQEGQPRSAVSTMPFPGLGEPPTFPRVRQARPSLRSANSGLSALDWWLCGASPCSPFSNFRFGTPETGSISDGDRFAELRTASSGIDVTARRSSKRDRGRAKHRPRAALVRARRRRQV